jgi:protein SCO1/2
MSDERTPPSSRLKLIRTLLWILVGLAIIGAAALLLVHRGSEKPLRGAPSGALASFGGPFVLVGADAQPFSSAKLQGKPYAIYFGFTRCGDVCPTTLSRLVRLRRDAANDSALNIVFVTIDPANDGPKEVGQYATLFGAPIIGLTGSQAQIDQVKKQYGIYAEPVPHAAMGEQMAHTATVLLFDRTGKFVATITPDEPDDTARGKLKKLIA